MIALGVMSNLAARSAIGRDEYSTSTSTEIAKDIRAWLREGLDGNASDAGIKKAWNDVEWSTRWVYGSMGFQIAGLGLVLVTGYANWAEMDSASKER